MHLHHADLVFIWTGLIGSVPHIYQLKRQFPNMRQKCQPSKTLYYLRCIKIGQIVFTPLECLNSINTSPCPDIRSLLSRHVFVVYTHIHPLAHREIGCSLSIQMRPPTSQPAVHSPRHYKRLPGHIGRIRGHEEGDGSRLLLRLAQSLQQGCLRLLGCLDGIQATNQS